MLLGIILFFDGALLALGNVRPACKSMPAFLLMPVPPRFLSIMILPRRPELLTVPIPYDSWRVSHARFTMSCPLRHLRWRT